MGKSPIKYRIYFVGIIIFTIILFAIYLTNIDRLPVGIDILALIVFVALGTLVNDLYKKL